MTSDLVEAAAEQLRTAADTGVPCAPVREVLGTSTDTDAAYAVQQRNVALAVARRPAFTERILVVVDDPQMLRYVRNTLMEGGYTPTLTGDPNEAVDLGAPEAGEPTRGLRATPPPTTLCGLTPTS